MRQDLFPSPEWDGQEPDGPQQGLFISLPAGELDAGRFAQCGPAKDLPPGPLLATVGGHRHRRRRVRPGRAVR